MYMYILVAPAAYAEGSICIMVVIFLSFSSLLQTLDLIKDTWLKPEDGFPTSICLIQGLFFLFLEKNTRPTHYTTTMTF